MTSCPLCGIVLASRASMGGHFTNAHPKASRHAEGPCEYARRDCSCSHCAEFNRVRSRARRAPFSPSLRIATPRPGWFDRAACKDEDPAWWHPDGTDNQTRAAKAVAICRRCPVRMDCLEHALNADEWLGIWGGTQPAERHRIAAYRARVREAGL